MTWKAGTWSLTRLCCPEYENLSLQRRIVDWVESRFGLRASVLRPVPEYSMNPLYWLGALTVIAFTLQVVTGLLLLIYYVPTVEQAYSSTLYVVNNVPLGRLLETVHLYGAYAMILLAFLHMFRGYFASAHKKPREMMWVIGMVMGLVVMGFGLTGYLLTWTVVSKSATDVSIGMLSFLPEGIGPTLTFLLAGVGSNASELARFFDLHIVVLPAALLLLLGLKMWMFETHGAAAPSTGNGSLKEVPWFPNVFLYIGMIGSAFVALVVAASVLFPINLAPEFTPLAASTNVPQPEWYFLWVYQILKFASFEGRGIYYALGVVTILALALIFLPFIDRSRERHPASRPLFVTLGIVLMVELVVLTVWGYLTPGVVIPDTQGVAVLLGAALSVGAMSYLTYRARRVLRGPSTVGSAVGAMALPFKHQRITALFLVPLTVGSVAFATLVGTLSSAAANIIPISLETAVLLASFYAMVWMLKLMVRPEGGISR